MKAAVVHGNRDIRVEEVEKPTIGDSDVLVKVRACGICGGDIHHYKVGAHPEIALPVASGGRILGHQWVGEVAKVGRKVPDLAVGDRIIGMGSFGAMSEYFRLGAESPALAYGLVEKIPLEVSDEEAAALESLFVGLTAVRRATPSAGDTVVIMGVGPIGLGLLQSLKLLSGVKVIAVGRHSRKRLAMAKQLGADEIVSAADVDPYERVLEIAGASPAWGVGKTPANVAIVYECAGHPVDSKAQSAIQQAMWMLRGGGTLVLVAGYEGTVGLDMNPVVYKELNLLGSLNTGPELVKQSIELIRNKKVNHKAIISHVFPLEKAKEAFETQLNTDEAIQVVIKP